MKSQAITFIVLLAIFASSFYTLSCKKSAIQNQNPNYHADIQTMNSLIAKDGVSAKKMLTNFQTNFLDYKSGKKIHGPILLLTLQDMKWKPTC